MNTIARKRNATPTIIQMEAVECGAASLGIVLAHYGQWVPLEQLRQECAVTRDGASAAAILRAARRHGLEGKGLQIDVDGLAEIGHPVIVFWAFQHFVVVERIVRNRFRNAVYINDPAGGRRHMSFDEFDRNYTGIAVDLWPGENFKTGGHKSRVVRDLVARLPPMEGSLPVLILSALLLAVVAVATAGFTRYFIDFVVGSGAKPGPLIAAFGVATAVFIALNIVLQGVLIRLSTRLSTFWGATFFRRLLGLSSNFHAQRDAADLGRRVHSNNSIADVMSRDVSTLALSGVLTIFYSAVLLVYDYRLAAVVLSLAALNLVVLVIIARWRRAVAAQLRADRGKLMATSFATIRQIETIKATGAENSSFQRWCGYYSKVISSEQRLGASSAAIAALPTVLSALSMGIVLLVGGERVSAGVLTSGVLVAFVGIMTNIERPVADLVGLGERLQDVATDLARIHDVEHYPIDTTDEVPTDLDLIGGSVQFEDVTYRHGPHAPLVVDGVSFTVPSGTMAALVGASGSGKSTVGRLVAGLVVPEEGSVKVGGIEVSRMVPEVRARALGYVDQSPVIFNATIRDNISLWDPSVTEDSVSRAIADAQLDQLINSLPNGADSMIVENGRNLSGGQRQRIAVARALVHDPRLIVLDEATSALDATVEVALMSALRRRGCTGIIIAHRLSTVRDADQIIVLTGGRIDEVGTHAELLDAEGAYFALVSREGEA